MQFKRQFLLTFSLVLLATILLWLSATHWAYQPSIAQIVDQPQVDIRPLSTIYTDGPPEIINIADSHVTLSFISSIPVVCSVIYGPDENYGMIAQDQNMNGAAITDHFPVMAGLEPETEYFYRVQGSDANGILYVSEPMTFTTAAVEEQADGKTNLASLEAGATVLAVSSNFGNAANDESWGANNAIDENSTTAWSSAGDGDDAFIEIQLPEPAQLAEVAVRTRFMSNNTAKISSFTLTGRTSTGQSQEVGPFTLPDANQAYTFAVDFGTEPIDVIRLDVVESNGGNTGLVDFAVYGSPRFIGSSSNNQQLYLPLIMQ